MTVTPLPTATATEARHVLAAHRRQIVTTTMQRLVPGYPRRRRLRALEQGIECAFEAILTCSDEGRSLTEADIPFIRSAVRDAAFRGGTEAEILRAPMVFFRVLWEVMTESLAHTEAGARSIVEFTPTVLEYVEAASRITHETHAIASEANSSLSSVTRFNLTDRLISGSAPEPGQQQSVARQCGLSTDSSIVVVVARHVWQEQPEMALPMAMRVLARSTTSAGVEPLAAVRHDEIVLIRATCHDEAVALAEVLQRAYEQLLSDTMPVAIASSTVHQTLTSVPAAYGEACLALDTLQGAPGYLSLATASPLDYLILRAGSATAWRLVPARIREFVSAELAGDRVLVDTLRAYLQCNMNVKRAAELLFVHPNTAHYRLDRIAERTGCDVRSFEDVEQLALAIRIGHSSSIGEQINTHCSTGVEPAHT